MAFLTIILRKDIAKQMHNYSLFVGFDSMNETFKVQKLYNKEAFLDIDGVIQVFFSFICNA